ncbi:putative damage-inducible protein DinB [Sediminibacterium goheungense]|uniref:Putative damage-inducible protein DinB n=2 Tax=Sediminibacterium goheungense TaxID=1086393 RepID=A0A4R6J0E8_9BACT|nr:putative damage-inducible protein DinB [Sediminibacterium goheungense]
MVWGVENNMKEKEKIAALFEAFYGGDCWIGLNFKQAIEGVNENLAAKSLGEGHNSIWQLVSHLIYWRKTVLIRLVGVLGTPSMSDFYQPAHTDRQAWEEVLAQFRDVQEELVKVIRQFPEEKMDEPSPMKSQTYYQLLTGCLQHDAYHMGQIILLKKML